jgi:hypothetical protein
MNEYKLIKKLPFENSPEIGYISKEIKGSKPLAHYWMGNWFDPKLYPEYWEVLKQTNYIDIKDLKEGQKVYRIWDSGHKSLGILIKEKSVLMFKSLESYSKEGCVYENEIYTLGDYKYELIEEDIEKEIEKDYEILSFIQSNGDIYNKSIHKDNFYAVFGNRYTEEYLLSHKNIMIHSVLRKSDNEIFTVNDKITGTVSVDETSKYGPGYTYIKSFIPNKFGTFDIKISTGIVKDYNKIDSIWRFLTIKKYKEISITTEDGVNLFEGDKGFIVENEPFLINKILCINISNKSFKLFPRRLWFSTKEKAEEYIFYNSPVLSLKEVGEIYLTAQYERPDRPTSQGTKIHNLVREKLKK